jgi:hypothetical protein
VQVNHFDDGKKEHQAKQLHYGAIAKVFHLKAGIMHMTELNRASVDKYIRSVGVRQIFQFADRTSEIGAGCLKYCVWL